MMASFRSDRNVLPLSGTGGIATTTTNVVETKKKKNAKAPAPPPPPRKKQAGLVAEGKPDVELVPGALNGGWPDGWIQRTFERASGKSAGSRDRYWYSPIKEYKLRSMVEVRRFLSFLDEYEDDEEVAWKCLKGGGGKPPPPPLPVPSSSSDPLAAAKAAAGAIVSSTKRTKRSEIPKAPRIKKPTTAKQKKQHTATGIVFEDGDYADDYDDGDTTESERSDDDDWKPASSGVTPPQGGGKIATLISAASLVRTPPSLLKPRSAARSLAGVKVRPYDWPPKICRLIVGGEIWEFSRPQDDEVVPATNGNKRARKFSPPQRKKQATISAMAASRKQPYLNGSIKSPPKEIERKSAPSVKKKQAYAARPKKQEPKEAPSVEPPKGMYEVGTPVYKHFPGTGYFWGEITRAVYTVEQGVFYRIDYEDNDFEEIIERESDSALLWKELKISVVAAKTKLRGCDYRVQGSNPDYMDLWTIHGVKPLGRAIAPFQDVATSNRVAEFFLFVHERHCMWERRYKLASSPSSSDTWSKNIAMSGYRFCNIYRELDRGTAFFHRHVLSLYDEFQLQKQSSVKDGQREWTLAVLWAAMAYRLVNRVESFEAMSFPPPAQDAVGVQRWLGRCRKYATDNVFFTGAHQTTCFDDYETALTSAVARNARALHSVVDKILATKTLAGCFNALKRLTKVGDFLGWQILCDLIESNCISASDCSDADSFCELGPGARDGISRIFLGSKDYGTKLSALVQHQEKSFEQIGISFSYWNGRRLAAKEIEHALCEYSKFTRLQTAIRQNETPFGKMRKWSPTLGNDEGHHPGCQIHPTARQHSCDTCRDAICSTCVHEQRQNSPNAAALICARCAALASLSFA